MKGTRDALRGAGLRSTGLEENGAPPAGRAFGAAGALAAAAAPSAAAGPLPLLPILAISAAVASQKASRSASFRKSRTWGVGAVVSLCVSVHGPTGAEQRCLETLDVLAWSAKEDAKRE